MTEFSAATLNLPGKATRQAGGPPPLLLPAILPLQAPGRSRSRKIDDKEQKLLQIEAEHLSGDTIDGCSLSSLASSYSSGGGGSSDEEASKVESECDLMKSMLREGLCRKSEKLGVVDNKAHGGILLHGPPGCGKTKLAHAIANVTGVPFYKIAATEFLSGVAGYCICMDFSTLIHLGLEIYSSVIHSLYCFAVSYFFIV
ncbi:hypothetical protein SASPL_100308 [Salvia splendens]|uniref:ATPase AAA-type core domain-containing protein n=1 Tax=Salvia splendens TaxID=180675 RepID=A0A8X9AD33_SALSN|nr:hypothetical protein SASPL_100308 [Salvia splendens]